MLRSVICIWLSGVAAAGTFPSSAQTSAGPPPAGADANHLEQLNNCRDGIVDPQARPEDRRRWINTLLAFDTPEARTLVVELLELAENAEAQRAVCEGIAEHAHTAPHRLAADFVDPLLRLLGTEHEEARLAAVKALADFPGAQVPVKLRKLAARPEAAMVNRLAAIDALASKVEHREVIGELMTLLDADVPQITERVLSALRPLSDEVLGSDVVRWRAWWAQKSKLSEQAWLADQLRMYRDRHRAMADEFDAYRDKTRGRHEAFAARLGEFQREIFRPLSEEDREVKLEEWLGDPLPEVQRTALAIIRGRIADEGRRPEGGALSALLKLLREGPPPIRREVLMIVQTLSDPAVVETVLDQLQLEEDPATRHSIFKAIGKLNSPRTIPALILEIAAPKSLPECVREAAIALGQVARVLDDRTQVADAVPALTIRYQAAPADDVDMRPALLAAMAGVADMSFAREFLAAVESDDARLLRPAIQGLVTIGVRSKLPRLRTLLAHTDPLVRLAAVEAVGELGGEDADLEGVLTRLNPSIEDNETVRDASWLAFHTLLSAKPIEGRIQAAQRLRETPELETRFLMEFLDAPALTNDHSAALEAVHDRLATIFAAQGKHGEAVPHLRELYETRIACGDAVAPKTGLRWLEATLRIPGSSEVVEVVARLAADAEERAKPGIINTVASRFDALESAGETQQVRALLEALRSVPPDDLGVAWIQLLDRVAGQLGADNTPVVPGSSP